ncbi:MAG: sulfite exporter TauE/SafE family protein [Saprospiraceae bacterium]
MELSILQIIVAIIGGLLAGIINTLAGNGSAITLSILTELMGLPANVANGTNRVGILMQGLSANYAFIKNKKVDFAKSKTMIIWMTLGAVLGVYVAINISNAQFKEVFKFLLIVLFFVVLIKPKKWMSEVSDYRNVPAFVSIPLYICLGFYGGFIQMGMGVLFLAVTVLLLGYNLIESNAIKNLVVFLYHIVVIAIFQYQGLIDWKVGGVIGIGQMTGGYLAAQYASTFPNAQIWAYRLLIVVMVIAILSVFSVF